MLKDSNSPQSDYNSLLSWLELPQTQEVLAALTQESAALREITERLIPARDLGRLMGDLLHREQSVGEIRGLERLRRLLDERKLELQVKLGLVKPNDIPEYETDTPRS